VAAYGLGLQGWDASYEFCSRVTAHLWWDTLSARGNVYNVDTPLQLGQYPAIARMVYRNDVEQGAPVAVRKVCVPALAEGRLDLNERLEQDGDVKMFRGGTPSEALAVGRVLVEFTEEPEPGEGADLAPYWDETARVVRSNTGQLRWDYSAGGCVTIDTPGTQAVVGAAAGRRIELGDLIVEVETPFVSLIVTSLEKDKPIAEAPALLVTAVARAMNTRMRYNEDGSELLEIGGPPILLEPVEATITLKSRAGAKVYALDHAGRRTDVELPVEGSAFHIGGKYATIYYEVRF